MTSCGVEGGDVICDDDASRGVGGVVDFTMTSQLVVRDVIILDGFVGDVSMDNEGGFTSI